MVVKRDGTLRVPLEVFVAWGQPAWLRVRRQANAVLLEVAERRPWRIATKAALAPWRKPRGLILGRVDPAGSGNGGWACFPDPAGLIPDGSYALANYHPTHQLCAIAAGAASAGTADPAFRAQANAETWQGIEGYHEHRPLAQQDPQAHAVSELLCETIAARLPAPRSILELGCGAGRNLDHIAKRFPDARVQGIDINPHAAASTGLPANATIVRANVLELDWGGLGGFDIVLTAGFLMHINHDAVRELMRRIRRHARLHLHWELHGPAQSWDFHRYPRCYRQLLEALSLPHEAYRIYAGDPVYSYGLTPSFAHALLIGQTLAAAPAVR